ncbi:MAG TPA: hypothetical protein PLY93_04870 [Turneriella sp.]|nr:hypothetical protein [Turneriella sp.]
MAVAKGLYIDFHKLELSHLKTLVDENKIDTALVDNLLKYWQRRLDDKKDAIYSRYIEYYLFFESIKALFFAVFIFDMKNGGTRHSYGIFPVLAPLIYSAINSAAKEKSGVLDFDHNGMKYALYFTHSGYHEQEYAVAALALKGTSIDDNLKRLIYVFERYYMPLSFSRDERTSFLFTNTANEIQNLTEKTLKAKKPVTFTYLYFESLTKYVSQSGESFARELLDELRADVHRILKDIDHSFVLSTREMLVVSLNCETEAMQKRFTNQIFRAKGLLLAVQLKFYTVQEPISDLNLLWNDITGNIAYQRKLKKL